MKILILFTLIALAPLGYAQTVRTGVCIILSSKNYTEAKKVAAAASKKLGMELDLRGLVPNKQSGLTMSRKACEEDGVDYPAYYSRGNDGADYISVEHSDAFDGFAKGYYIVVLATGDNSITGPVLRKAKKFYKTAYVKQTDIFVGCSH